MLDWIARSGGRQLDGSDTRGRWRPSSRSHARGTDRSSCAPGPGPNRQLTIGILQPDGRHSP